MASWSGVARAVHRAEALDLVVLVGVGGAVEVARAGRAELRRRQQRERVDLGDPRVRVDDVRRWNRPPLAGLRADGERERHVAAVAVACLQHRRRRRGSSLHAERLRRAIGDGGQRLVVLAEEGGADGIGECRHRLPAEAVEHAIGGGGDRSIHRRRRRRRRETGEEGLVPAVDRVHRVVDGALHHGHVQHRNVRRLARRAQRGEGVGVPGADRAGVGAVCARWSVRHRRDHTRRAQRQRQKKCPESHSLAPWCWGRL